MKKHMTCFLYRFKLKIAELGREIFSLYRCSKAVKPEDILGKVGKGEASMEGKKTRTKTQPSIKMCITFIVCITSICTTLRAEQLVIATMADLHGQIEPAHVSIEGHITELGGFTRIRTKIQELNERFPGKVLTVASGDYCTGKYFQQYKGKAIYSLMNDIGIDVATLGNHDFDMGKDVSFLALKYCSIPIVVTNMTFPPLSNFHNHFLKKMIIKRNNITIGIIGLMTPDIVYITGMDSDDLTISRNITSLAQKAVDSLRTKHKVDIVIALTHIGLKEDIKLAQRVDDIDIICGGHSHDTLQTGEEIVIQKPLGNPTIITHPGSHGNSIGVLELEIDSGAISGHNWELITLNTSIPKNAIMKKKIEHYRNLLPNDLPITETIHNIDLRKQVVRGQESGWCNLIATIVNNTTNGDVTLLNGGNFRGGLVIPPGTITSEHLSTIFPFGNKLMTMKLSGKYIKQVLERGVASLPYHSGSFIHVAGMRYHIDPQKQPQTLLFNNVGQPYAIETPGKRITSIEISTSEGYYTPLSDEKEYTVTTTSFIAQGGDGFFMFQHGTERTESPYPLSNIITDILETLDSISPQPEGRITFH